MNSRASKIPVPALVRIANRKDGKSFFRVLPLLACGNRGFKIPRRRRRLRRKRHLKVSSSETSARLSHSLTLSNVGELPWSLILKKDI